ncbi:hypothetical protein ACHQM5_020227 [Ranunculus cassubicifolius]
MADIAGAVGGLLTCLCTPNCLNTAAFERCKFAINPTKHIKELVHMKADLVSHKRDVIRRLDREEIEEGKKRSNVVKQWLKDVDQFLVNTNVIQEEAIKTRRHLIHFLPNCCSHSRMGSNISRLLREGTKLLEKTGEFSGEALTITEERRGIEFPVGRIIGETTAHGTMEKVWDCLINKEIGTIGIYGMGGVGKTTIVTEINNRLLKQKLVFGTVIWVTVSQNTTIRQIQNTVARALSHTLPDLEDGREVAASLSQAFKKKKKKRKKVLLILDDMWEEVSLLEIGIPEPTEESGCKILLTTRKLEVCQRMGCREEGTIKVEPLLKEEAWELFMDKVGVELSEEVRKIAVCVVEECSCLPLAIVTVGGAMRGNKNISEWRVALNDLRQYRNQIVNMEKHVFNCLKFSYDRLPDEKFRKCFLYCALYPEDWKFVPEELIHNWIMDGLIEEGDSQDEIHQGQFILNKLIHHCLLESGHDRGGNGGKRGLNERVKMHDLIRDMALQFTSLLVKAGVFLRELPKEAAWSGDLEIASFMYNRIENISIWPNCPKLSILLLSSNQLQWIDSRFFVQMQGLRVLDLSNNPIKSLPDSFSDLVNLHVLHLKNCYRLKTLPSFSKLQLLRILDLRGSSNLESLPDSVSDLIKLRALILSECSKLKWIPSVAKLLSLRTLELSSTGIEELPEGFELLQGMEQLKIQNFPKLFSVYNSSPSTMLRRLTVSVCNGLENVFSSPTFLQQLQKLEEIDIQNCDQLEEIIKSKTAEEGADDGDGEATNIISLPELERLDIKIQYCPKLHSVYIGILSSRLRRLEISSCHDLENVFSSPRLLQRLQMLEEIDIRNCDQLGKITKGTSAEEGADGEETGEATNILALPKLKWLTIENCPKLRVVEISLLGTELRRLDISSCHRLKNVFTSPRLLQQIQNLEEIQIRNCDQLENIIKGTSADEGAGGEVIEEATNIITLPKLKWLDIHNFPKPQLHPVFIGIFGTKLRRLEISCRYDLKSVFSSPRILQQLQNLETIIVDSCDQLEDIVEASTSEATNIITLPKLKLLSLRFLPKLKNIWKGEMVWDSLQSIEVYACNELKRLPIFRGGNQLSPPLLTNILGSREWWDSLEWDHPSTKILLQPIYQLP